ncbi:helix-turn-helix domain-containing protein [Mycobacterium sp. 4D054]|uniref:helix-turn-helix domain-containing protein n=1 Tax=Mycobacterium sp. 4D054 TaxID=3457440 RepID=UPI003FD2E96E
MVPTRTCRSPSLSWGREWGSGMTRSKEQFDAVQLLIAMGKNDCEIARQTGIPRKTVWQWRRRPGTGLRLRAGNAPCGVEHDFTGLPAGPYAYLLGMYLGDGCISRGAKTYRLRITCDKRYLGIIHRCCASIDGQVQGRGVRRRRVILRGDGSGGQCRGGGLLFGRGVVDGA